MIVMGTGHRPSKLGNCYNKTHPKRIEITNKLKEVLQRAKANTSNLQVISGGALGLDQWIAEAAIELDIPVLFYIPFKGQESNWPQQSKDEYFELLAKGKEIKYICSDGYAPWKMEQRNEAMVNDSDYAIALWDGASGGTANCVKSLSKKNKPYLKINPHNLEEIWVYPEKDKNVS